MTANTPGTIAEMLLDAAGTRFAINPPRMLIPGLNLDDAYRIQLLQQRALLAQGKEIVGRKIGLTSAAMQQQLGVDNPDFGFFTRDTIFEDGAEIPAAKFIAPRVEPEVAVVLDRDLGAGEDLVSVAAAVRSIHVAVEIIDSRVKNWDITLVDTVADNASGAGVILGPEITAQAEDLPTITAVMSLNGAEVARGMGVDVMGHPLAPVVWLATELAERGAPLTAGEIILTGSFCAASPVVAGDQLNVDYGEYGGLSVTFS